MQQTNRRPPDFGINATRLYRYWPIVLRVWRLDRMQQRMKCRPRFGIDAVGRDWPRPISLNKRHRRNAEHRRSHAVASCIDPVRLNRLWPISLRDWRLDRM